MNLLIGMKGLTKNDLQDLKFAIMIVYSGVCNSESNSKVIKEIAAKQHELIEKIEYEMELKQLTN